MERLTERMTDGIIVKEDYGEETLKTIYKCYGSDAVPHYANCDEGYCAMEKLAEYEDLEEQELLLKLPCKNWMDIVFGEQEIFWGINVDYIENPVREINVDSSERFTWYDGWETVLMKGADENGLDWEFPPTEIGKTDFLTREEAEAKLAEMEEQNGKTGLH